MVGAEEGAGRGGARLGKAAGAPAPGAPVLLGPRHAQRTVGVAAMGAQNPALVEGQGAGVHHVVVVPHEGEASLVDPGHGLVAVDGGVAHHDTRRVGEHLGGHEHGGALDAHHALEPALPSQGHGKVPYSQRQFRRSTVRSQQLVLFSPELRAETRPVGGMVCPVL